MRPGPRPRAVVVAAAVAVAAAVTAGAAAVATKFLMRDSGVLARRASEGKPLPKRRANAATPSGARGSREVAFMRRIDEVQKHIRTLDQGNDVAQRAAIHALRGLEADDWEAAPK